MQRFMAERGLAHEYACPALPPLAEQAICAVERRLGPNDCFIGSSLGGFYATYLAEKHRLPSFGSPIFARAGGLIAYGPDGADMYRRAAGYVDRILRGMQPASIPMEGPTKFEMIVNLKTAKALGLTISRELLARADQVIE